MRWIQRTLCGVMSAGVLYACGALSFLYPLDHELYVVVAGSSGWGVWSVNQRSGELTQTYFESGVARNALAHPSGRFLYVTDNTNDWFRVYLVEAGTGALTLLEEFTGLIDPDNLAVDPGGRFLYLQHQDNIRTNTIDAGTGALTSFGDTAFGGVGDLLVDPTGAYLFAQDPPPATRFINAYSIDQTNGTLTVGTGNSNDFAPIWGMTNGTLLMGNGSSMTSYTQAFAGDLSTGRNIETTVNGLESGGTIHPSFRFAYAYSFGNGTISVYDLSSTGRPLGRVGSEVPVAGSPIGAIAEPAGRMLFVASSSPDVVESFHIDGNGVPSLVSSLSLMTTPVAITIISIAKSAR